MALVGKKPVSTSSESATARRWCMRAAILLISLTARSVHAQITPASSHSNTQQSSTTDGTDTDTFIPGASLTNGVEHLVIYNAVTQSTGQLQKSDAQGYERLGTFGSLFEGLEAFDGLNDGCK